MNVVQQSRVKHPTQPGFSLSEWNKALHDSNDDSAEAGHLHQAGVWVDGHLSEIRSNLESLPKCDVPHALITRLTVGLVNTALAHVTAAGLETVEKSPVFTPAIGDDTEALIENIVAGARYAISTAASVASAGKSELLSNEDEIIGVLGRRIELGAAYDTLEQLWASCLWNGYRVNTTSNGDVVEPQDDKLARLRAVGNFRRDSLLLEMSVYSVQLWPKYTPEIQRQIAGGARITGITKRSKRKRFTLARVSPDPTHPPTECVIRTCASELYLDSILHSSLQKTPGIAPVNILDAWEAIAPLGGMLADRHRTMSYANTFGRVLEFAPLFDRRAFIEAIRASTGLVGEESEYILELFTFRGIPQDDPWCRPLVTIEGEKLALISVALAVPNLLRSIEYWLVEGGVDMGDRGLAFEAHVRERLSEENSLPAVEVYDSSVEMPDPIGDIDLCVRVGNTVLVGELKCSVFPVSPLMIYRYESVLESAAVQARNKSDALSKNAEDLLSSVFPDIALAEVSFLPVVVTNLPHGAGFAFDGVPVVDLVILLKFFRDGYVDEGYMKLSGPVNGNKRIRFFDDPASAESALATYLAAPPQITNVASSLTDQVHPLLGIVGGSPVSVREYGSPSCPTSAESLDCPHDE